MEQHARKFLQPASFPHTKFPTNTAEGKMCTYGYAGLWVTISSFRLRERFSDGVKNRVGVRVRVGGQVSHRHSQNYLWGALLYSKVF